MGKWIRHQWARRAAGVIAGLLGLWLLAWLAVPPLLKSQIESRASAALGRAVSVGGVDFRPWSLELDLRNLAIAGMKPEDPPLLRVARLHVNAELQSLLRWAPVVDELRIEAPELVLRHLGPGRYDIDDLLARFAQPQPDPAEAAAPLRFALYNLTLEQGSIEFIDDAVGRTHAVRDLRIAVPFLSSLPSQREVKVAPRLAFNLNGSQFDSEAQATPFDASRRADVALQLTGFDLTPYLGYLPSSLPVRLRSGVVDAQIKLAFEQNPDPAVRLTGALALSRVQLADRAGSDLLAFDRLSLGLDDVRPLERVVRLGTVRLEQPVLDVRRDAAGRLNLLELVADRAASGVPAQAATRPAAASSPAAPARDGSGWSLETREFIVAGGRLRWQDALARPAARLEVSAIGARLGGIRWPVSEPVAIQFDADLAGGHLNIEGSATDREAQLALRLQSLALKAAAPYLAQWLVPQLEGTLGAELGLRWMAPAGIELTAQRLTLDGLALVAGRQSLASVRQIELGDGRIDWSRRTANAGRLRVVMPRIPLARDAQGRWMVESWLRAEPADTSRAPASSPGHAPAGGAARDMTVSASSARPSQGRTDPAGAEAWSLSLGAFDLEGGMLSWQDLAAPRPVELDLTALRIEGRGLSNGRQSGTLHVSTRLGAPRAEPGRLDFRGRVGLEPLLVQGKLDARALPLQVLSPYLQSFLNIELLRAEAGFRGDVRFAQESAGPAVRVSGDVQLEDFRANTAGPLSASASTAPLVPVADGVVTGTSTGRPTAAPAHAPVSGPGAASAEALRISEELLSWKTLNLRGLDVALSPGRPTQVEVRETTLADFYARIAINEAGRINLQDLVRASDAAARPGASGASGAASGPEGAASRAAAGESVGQGGPAPAIGPVGGASAPAVGPAPATAAAPAQVRFGPISLVNGRVLFSDRFVKPNYSANLSELTGRLGAFSSVPPDAGAPQMADLDLRGRAEGTATLEITGRLNPLAQPLALDVRGKVRDLELPALSPYSVKYAGHGIERGKLSLDVNYRIQPDGQLTASNNLVLNQLTFGEAVPGAPNSLPVRLAVALLADRNGVIDINLPVSGSLNDPQFSIGPIIFKVIVNLVVKAITSPFSLLASAFGGGGDELGAATFVPGTAVLAPGATQSLDKVAKALTDRPTLRMTVIGTASIEVERDAYRRDRLRQLLLAEKRREAIAAGQSVTGPGPTAVSDAEYPALLKEVYRRADMPKPRNLIGMTRDLPVPEMEALLLANIAADEQALRELAVARAVTVRDYLAAQKLPTDRLFLGAPRVVDAQGRVTGAGASATPVAPAANPGAAWSPRAELELATR
jgi:hypothetical protein